MGSDRDIFQRGYALALLLLFCVGVLLIAQGTQSPQGSFWNVVLTGTGISMAPSAVVAALFRVFLFTEVRHELTSPIVDLIRGQLGPEVRAEVVKIVDGYRSEISMLTALREAGGIHPFRARKTALRKFASAIDAETREITIVGSSLKGLLQNDDYQDIAQKLRFKIETGHVRVKFLLTHPVVADLRARQENKPPKDIGSEIIRSLVVLKDWKVSPENVRLYRGTPTCFGIKTSSRMLLNPYPYGSVAYDSPCLLVETSDEHPSYFYDQFDESHFSCWETDVAARFTNYDDLINELQTKLDAYAASVAAMFQT